MVVSSVKPFVGWVNATFSVCVDVGNSNKQHFCACKVIPDCSTWYGGWFVPNPLYEGSHLVLMACSHQKRLRSHQKQPIKCSRVKCTSTLWPLTYLLLPIRVHVHPQ